MEATSGSGHLTLIWMFVGFLGLIGRVRIHQWDDTVRAQRMGARIWTAFVALTIAIDFFAIVVSKHATCDDLASLYSSTYGGLALVWIVLLTGSHGMSFTHKFGLTCGLTLEPFLFMSACGVDAQTPEGPADFAVG